MKSTSIVVFVALSMLGATASDAQPVPFDQRHASRQAQWRYVRSAEEFKSVDLTALPQFADLPAYTGRSYHFVAGQEFPQMKTGRVVNVEFCTLEGPAVVGRWYRAVLTQFGWAIESSASGDLEIAARRDNKSCRISISDTAEEGYASQVTIVYKEDRG